MNKTELINWLVDDDINTISNCDGLAYLDSLLREGFQGYRNQTVKQLEQ